MVVVEVDRKQWERKAGLGPPTSMLAQRSNVTQKAAGRFQSQETFPALPRGRVR